MRAFPNAFVAVMGVAFTLSFFTRAKQRDGLCEWDRVIIPIIGYQSELVCMCRLMT